MSDLFIKVCQAIQHAHQKGIIHRDIKPSNILVTLHDGVPVPKVIDFGIAKATAGRLTDLTVYTELHQFIGTPAYMSPEQAEMSGLDIDTRSDIYSLGVLLYELLTSKTPFDGQELRALGIDEMRKTIREKEPVRPSTRLTQELAKVGKWESEKVGDAVRTVSDSHSPTYSPAHSQPRQLKHGQKLHRLISQLRGAIVLTGSFTWDLCALVFIRGLPHLNHDGTGNLLRSIGNDGRAGSARGVSSGRLRPGRHGVARSSRRKNARPGFSQPRV